MTGKNATPLIGWHSTDPTLKPWLEAEVERRGMETMRELLDEMAAEYRERVEFLKGVAASGHPAFAVPRQDETHATAKENTT